jgi:hypothetical protein
VRGIAAIEEQSHVRGRECARPSVAEGEVRGEMTTRREFLELSAAAALSGVLGAA